MRPKITYQNVDDITVSVKPGKGLMLFGFAKGFTTPTKFENPTECARKFRAGTILPEGWGWTMARNPLAASCEALVIDSEQKVILPALVEVAVQAAKDARQDRLVEWLQSLQQ